LKIDLKVKINIAERWPPIVLNNFCLNNFFVFVLPTEILRCVD